MDKVDFYNKSFVVKVQTELRRRWNPIGKMCRDIKKTVSGTRRFQNNKL